MTQRHLVTGGAGFIGSALVRRLVADRHHVLNLDALTYAAPPGALAVVADAQNYRLERGSIADRALVKKLIEDFQPDRVMNLAAESHVDRSIDDPSTFVTTNVVGTAVLLEEATAYWQQLDGDRRESFRFVHVSTDEVFGSIHEGFFTLDSPYDPSSPYAASKAAGDHLMRAWHRTYGIPTIVTNCTNNYGPFQFPEKLIPLMIVRAAQRKPLPVYGDGSNVRDWLHVDDHVSGLVLAGDRGEPGQTYLFGARATRSNLELVRTLCGLLDKRLPDGAPHTDLIEMVPDRPGHDERYAIDPSSGERLGFEPTWTLEEGLAATVDWYLEQRRWWQSILDERYKAERLGLQ